jgi:hypothetical protein
MILAEQVIAELLRKYDAGTYPDDNLPWPVFVGRLPTEPDECIAVYRVEIPTEGRIHRIGTAGHEGLQVRSRHKEYEPAQKKILEIAELFDQVLRDEVTYETGRYRINAITQTTRAAWIGPDPNNRANFVLNCMASINEV